MPNRPFGWELVLDLSDCDARAIRSRSHITAYARKLCRVIHMKPFGKPFVARFGLGKDFTAGYSLVQLIETSSITGHFSELWRRAHINIFSCKEFDVGAAAKFTQEHFGAEKMRKRLLTRRGAGGTQTRLPKAVEKEGRWIYERTEPFDESHQRFGYRVKRTLYRGRSRYQTIEVFELEGYGKALFLDGILQITEADEFIYHEMLCHPPLLAHPSPKKVLIIGGGDGGALREVLKHPVERAWLAEIDEQVLEVCQKYIPSVAKGALQDRRARVIVGDGEDFVGNYEKMFDAIILDLSDPIGPAERLISLPFYRNVKRALKAGGIVSVQSGSLGGQPRLVALINRRLKKAFRYVQVRKACIQTYPVGEFSFTLASDTDFRRTTRRTLENRLKKHPKLTGLKYWSPQIHFASTILPRYFSEKLNTK